MCIIQSALPGNTSGEIQAIMSVQRFALLVATAALTLTGCASAETSSNPAEESGQRHAPLWQADGLDAQPRLPELRAIMPEDMGFDPGSTQWREADAMTPRDFEPAARETATPGALLFALAAQRADSARLGRDVWETTLRVLEETDDKAIGIIMEWGLKDDAVAGQDMRVRMRREGDEWSISGMERRFHCSRGVTDTNRCQ